MEDEDEDYIFYGTLLPELEEEHVLRKKAARELEVRDEKGRQRLHGAFTGGFSAGYFNTVGTKEGWQPSTFVSSRNKFSDHVAQKPEDFMDSEDFGEFGIATKRIHATSNFEGSSDSSTKKRKFGNTDSVIPGEAPLKDIVKPVRESIGIKILNKLGWKLGQGIGPRIKKTSIRPKVYGCAPFPENITAEEDDPVAIGHTFAPDDIDSQFYQPKGNHFGLGYSGLSKDSVLGSHVDLFNPTSTKSFLKKDKKKLTITGQAFGVGAFEDDDDDIYAKDDMSQYDFSEFTGTGKQHKNEKAYKSVEKLSHLLECFRLASQPPTVKKYYKPPDLPPNFRPHLRSADKTEPQVMTNLGRHNLSAVDRSIILGEKSLQSFIPEPQKEKTIQKPDWLVKLNSQIAKKSSHQFKPFPSDDLKQRRYEDFLSLKEHGDVATLLQPSSMTEWEKQQELEEFDRASILFRPLSDALSAKFESRSHLNVEHEVMDELQKIKSKQDVEASKDKKKLVGTCNRKTLEWHPASLLCKRFNVPNPYPNDTSTGVPTSLNSKSLFSHLSFKNTDSEEKSLTESQNAISSENVPLVTSNDSISDITRPMDNSAKDTNSKSSQEQKEIGTKPPIDFFKDIFENSSDEEESGDSQETSTEHSVEKNNATSDSKSLSNETTPFSPVQPSKIEKPDSVPHNRPGFGVFANLDLDALNQRAPRKETIKEDSKVALVSCDDKIRVEEVKGDNCTDHQMKNICDISSLKEVSVDEASNRDRIRDSDLYAPVLPPGFNESLPSSSPTQYLERHKKHKTKHKHKHHKHKSKKKKKRKNSYKSSDDSDSDDSDNISNERLDEKIKRFQRKLK